MSFPSIPNAFANVQAACSHRLQELYPLGTPAPIQERFDAELAYMKASPYADDFEIFRLLSLEALKCSQYFTLRGQISGSILIFLLGRGRFHPFAPHYYCPHCGHFESVETHMFGIDLPEIPCSDCGSTVLPDGFGLPVESIWGLDGKRILSFDYSVCEEFLPFAKHVLEKVYPDHEIVLYGTPFFADRDPEKDRIEIKPGGFTILPEGQTMDDYPDLKTYLEDGEPCLFTFAPGLSHPDLKVVNLIPSPDIENLIQLQRKTGTYANEIPLSGLRSLTCYDLVNTKALSKTAEDLVRAHKPKTFMEIAKFESLGHASYAGSDRNPPTADRIDRDLLCTEEYQKYPCASRDDFFESLLEAGCPREDAFEISEFIRKGKALSFGHKLEGFDIPAEIKTLAKKFCYLFPRAHSVETVLLVARLAYYQKMNSRIYSKIIHKTK